MATLTHQLSSAKISSLLEVRIVSWCGFMDLSSLPDCSSLPVSEDAVLSPVSNSCDTQRTSVPTSMDDPPQRNYPAQKYKYECTSWQPTGNFSQHPKSSSCECLCLCFLCGCVSVGGNHFSSLYTARRLYNKHVPCLVI